MWMWRTADRHTDWAQRVKSIKLLLLYERSVARELECEIRDVSTWALTRVLAHECARLRLHRKKRKSMWKNSTWNWKKIVCEKIVCECDGQTDRHTDGLITKHFLGHRCPIWGTSAPQLSHGITSLHNLLTTIWKKLHILHALFFRTRCLLSTGIITTECHSLFSKLPQGENSELYFSRKRR